MRRMPSTLFICALLSSAPLVTGLALAEPATTTERSVAQPAPPSRSPGDMGSVAREAITVPGVESSVPATPMPLNLPDEATATEVKSGYGIGITSLVVGGLLLAAIVVGVLLMISRRSWSASH